MQTDAGRSSPTAKTPWVHFVAGGSGATISTIVTFPLDVVKTRFQSDFYHSRISARSVAGGGISDPGAPLRQGILHIKDTVEILTNIYKFEGWRTLFKGLGPNLCSFVPESAIGFYAYGNSKRILADTFNHGQESTGVHLSAASFSGIATETCTNPLWVIKTRLQLDKDRSSLSGGKIQRMYKGSWDCAVNILHNEGVRGLYRGLAVSYLGVSEFVMQWVLYERMKLALRIGGESKEAAGRARRLDSSLEWGGKLGAAAASKLVAAVIAYPHEVIRTRLRQRPPESGKLKYTGCIQCFKIVWKQEGLAGLYGGLCPHLLRVVPGAAILFGTYETVLEVFGDEH